MTSTAGGEQQVILTWLGRISRRRGRVPWKLLVQRRLGESLVRTASYLFGIFALHTAAMIAFEGLTLGDAVWLTLTTVTTVGYGDISAATLPGRTATALLLYTGGIFVLAKLAGDYFEYRTERRERMSRGEWEWDMENHILIINAPHEEPEGYFARLIDQFRATNRYEKTPVQILSKGFDAGLPASLGARGNVVHYHGTAGDSQTLEITGAKAAEAIVVLAHHEHDPSCDSLTFDTLHRLRELGVTATILAESVRDSNRARFYQAGADIVIRPIRAYPGMVVRGFMAPGAERVMEELFRSNGGEYRRYNVSIDGLVWADVVSRLVKANCGVAAAYREPVTGDVITSPAGHTSISTDAIFVLVGAETEVSQDTIAEALGKEN